MKLIHFSMAVAVAASLTLACGATPSADSPHTTAAVADSPLEGKSFDVTLSIPGEAPEKDTLRFGQGKFESTACTPLGFPQWSEYSAKADGSATAFHVVTRHPDGTSVQWDGSVRGSSIDGTATRTMKGTTTTGKFSGAVRK